jgi:hypothetical protein
VEACYPGSHLIKQVETELALPAPYTLYPPWGIILCLARIHNPSVIHTLVVLANGQVNFTVPLPSTPGRWGTLLPLNVHEGFRLSSPLLECLILEWVTNHPRIRSSWAKSITLNISSDRVTARE